jgi:hypothetical protein
MYWLMCQKGLFYQAFRFLRDSRLGGRLHIFICVRDFVYSSIFESEHATRYLDARHIRLLEWDTASIRYLLAEKLQRLDERYFLAPAKGKSIEAWLGVSVVHNKRRDRAEQIEDYIVRHTRLLPRDIVTLGNDFCARVDEARRAGKDKLDDVTIRRVVHRSARIWGNEQIAICANQITSDLMHAGAALQDLSELYTNADPSFTGADIYQRHVADRIKDFIEGVGRDSFDRRRFRRAEIAMHEEYEDRTDVMSVLWQNGLLGYRNGGNGDGDAIFYSVANASQLAIPRDVTQYVFHPCLLDTVRIASDGPGSPPVIPCYSEAGGTL